MDHVAIMNRKFGNLIGKILRGEKKIESRWSKFRIMPWNRVGPGDVVYFKYSGEAVIAKAEVADVKQFEDLNKNEVKNILDRWGGKDGIDVTSYENALEWAKERKYCVLVFLGRPERVEPFRINKAGFGSPAAWLCMEDINKIKL